MSRYGYCVSERGILGDEIPGDEINNVFRNLSGANIVFLGISVI